MPDNSHAPAQQVQTAIVKGKSLSVTISDDDGLAGRFMREIVSTGVWGRKPPKVKKGVVRPPSYKNRDYLIGADRAVLVALCNYILAYNVTESGEPFVWPSQTTIQRLCGMERASVQKSLEVLQRLGLITEHAQGRGLERSIYVLHWASRATKSRIQLSDATEAKAAELRALKTAPPMQTGSLFDGGEASYRMPPRPPTARWEASYRMPPRPPTAR